MSCFRTKTLKNILHVLLPHQNLQYKDPMSCVLAYQKVTSHMNTVWLARLPKTTSHWIHVLLARLPKKNRVTRWTSCFRTKTPKAMRHIPSAHQKMPDVCFMFLSRTKTSEQASMSSLLAYPKHAVAACMFCLRAPLPACKNLKMHQLMARWCSCTKAHQKLFMARVRRRWLC